MCMFNVFIFILGVAIGSFLNVLIDRLVDEETIMGRSHCDHCKKTLEPLDLIPIVSFVFLRGKCRYCHTKLSWQYPVIEFLTGIIFVGIMNNSLILIPNSLFHLSIACVFIVIFVADLKKHIIPDEMQIALFVTVFFLKVFQGMTVVGFGYALIEGMIVMTPILFLYLLTKGRGMGFGDVKLALNIGFFVGIKAGLISLYIAFITGAIVGAVMLLTKRKKMKSKIAFGPFIILGVVIMILFKDQIFPIILQIYGL